MTSHPRRVLLIALATAGPAVAIAMLVIWRGDFTLAPAGGLFRAHVALAQEVRAGDRLYTITDTFGAVRYEHHAPHDGLVSAICIFGAIQEGDWDIAVLEAVQEES